jgi:hypothetical protein
MSASYTCLLTSVSPVQLQWTAPLDHDLAFQSDTGCVQSMVLLATLFDASTLKGINF